MTWLFISTNKGFSAYVLTGRRLVRRWTKTAGGTSPVVAGGLLFVYDWNGGALNVYVPTTGRRVASLPVGRGGIGVADCHRPPDRQAGHPSRRRRPVLLPQLQRT